VSATQATRAAVAATTAPDTHPDRWRMLALLALAELLGMSLWMSGSAVAPLLAAREPYRRG
jgi:hypothetical protein